MTLRHEVAVLPHQLSANAELARPRSTQRVKQAVACPAASGAAGVAPNAIALARPDRCPPLDLSAPTTGSTTYRTADPRPGAADGPRESPLGLQAHPGRADRPRPRRCRLDRLEDPEERWARPGSPPVRATWRQFLSTQAHAILAVDFVAAPPALTSSRLPSIKAMECASTAPETPRATCGSSTPRWAEQFHAEADVVPAPTAA